MKPGPGLNSFHVCWISEKEFSSWIRTLYGDVRNSSKNRKHFRYLQWSRGVFVWFLCPPIGYTTIRTLEVRDGTIRLGPSRPTRRRIFLRFSEDLIVFIIIVTKWFAWFISEFGLLGCVTIWMSAVSCSGSGWPRSIWYSCFKLCLL
jgi:hypothetical protein